MCTGIHLVRMFFPEISTTIPHLISERIKSGLAVVKSQGKKLGRQSGEHPKSDRRATKVMARISEGRSYR